MEERSRSAYVVQRIYFFIIIILLFILIGQRYYQGARHIRV